MQTFTVTSPNTCGLVDTGAGSAVYVGGVGLNTYTSDTATFAEYLTSGDAATAALLIDPTFDLGLIYGPIDFTSVVSGGGDYNYGEAVSLNFAVTPTDPSVTVAYQWKDGSGFPIAGETGDTLSFAGVSEASSGTYVCEATLNDPATGQTQVQEQSFDINVGAVSGSFYLTRNATNITSGLYTASQGFDRELSSIYLVDDALEVIYDPAADGFKTVGGQLGTVDQVFELRVNGSYVKTFTLPDANGTFTFTF